MKLNNKGFAISGILYAVMILFLTLVVSLLAMIQNRKLVLDNYKKEIKEKLNSEADTFGARIQIDPDYTYIRVNEDELVNYDIKSNVSGCLAGGSSLDETTTLCASNETDITNLLSYKIYDEIGNEVINFYSEKIYLDGFNIENAYYMYFQKDSSGNYLLDETKNNLKTVKKYLTSNIENIFYVRYYVIDNKNTLSKEATKTLVVNKYANYINVISNYFKVNKNNIISYNFLKNANCYKFENNELVKDNSLLNYEVYNSNDEKIEKFYQEGSNWYYKTANINNEVTIDEKFRIRYFTGNISKPTSDIEFAYFTIE